MLKNNRRITFLSVRKKETNEPIRDDTLKKDEGLGLYENPAIPQVYFHKESVASKLFSQKPFFPQSKDIFFILFLIFLLFCFISENRDLL